MKFPEFSEAPEPKETPPPPPPPEPSLSPRGFRLSVPAEDRVDIEALVPHDAHPDAPAEAPTNAEAPADSDPDGHANADAPTTENAASPASAAHRPTSAGGFALHLGDAVTPPRTPPRKSPPRSEPPRKRVERPRPAEVAVVPKPKPKPKRKGRPKPESKAPPAPRWRAGEIFEGFRLLDPVPTRPRRRTFPVVGVYDGRRATLETWVARGDTTTPAAAARLTALSSPGLVTVLATGEVAGRAFTILDEHGGEPLGRTLQWARQENEPSAFGAGKKGVERGVEVIAAAARAIDAAHEAGVAHGHLGPQEIALGTEGRPIVSGLGVDPARYHAPASDELPYVAPEQWRGETTTPATDVFALGAILFECLTLQSPFAGPTERAYVENVGCGEIADARELNPAVTEPIATVIARALERNPSHRYPTGGALADALAAARSGAPVAPARGASIRAARRWMRRHHRLAIAAVAIIGLGVTMTVFAALSAMRAEWRARALSTRADTLEREVAAMNQLRLRERMNALAREGRALWPSRPGWERAMESWLIRAAEVVESRPVVIDATARLAADTSPDAYGARAWSRAALEALIDELDLFGSLVNDVEDRLATGRAAHEASVIEHRLRWQRCLRAIAINPRYIGTRFKPEPGLVPLGTDPESGLHEFAHVSSGDLPRRDPTTGRLERRARDAIVLVLIPASEYERRDGSRARIAPFLIAKHELTRAQFARLTGSREAPSALPVSSLDWRTARRVLNRGGLDLPTEVQWEIAATADLVDPAIGGPADPAIGGPADPAIKPGGTAPPNGYGLHDVFGNVAEWCRDPFGPRAFPPRPGDGLRLEHDAGEHVVKGAAHFPRAESSAAGDRHPVSARRAWRGPSRLVGVRPARWSSGVSNTRHGTP